MPFLRNWFSDSQRDLRESRTTIFMIPIRMFSSGSSNTKRCIFSESLVGERVVLSKKAVHKTKYRIQNMGVTLMWIFQPYFITLDTIYIPPSPFSFFLRPEKKCWRYCVVERRFFFERTHILRERDEAIFSRDLKTPDMSVTPICHSLV